MTRDHIISLFNTGFLPLLAVIGISIFSLVAALIGQYGFDLQPCVLCIYQRWPFVIAAVIAVAALCVRDVKMRAFGLILSAVSFFVNMGIAIFHVGVEQKWWKGTEACHLPDLSSVQSTEDFIALMEASSRVPCDEIPFEIYGVSMAGMNVMLCFVMGLFCAASAVYLVRKSNGF